MYLHKILQNVSDAATTLSVICFCQCNIILHSRKYAARNECMPLSFHSHVLSILIYQSVLACKWSHSWFIPRWPNFSHDCNPAMWMTWPGCWLTGLHFEWNCLLLLAVVMAQFRTPLYILVQNTRPLILYMPGCITGTLPSLHRWPEWKMVASRSILHRILAPHKPDDTVYVVLYVPPASPYIQE